MVNPGFVFGRHHGAYRGGEVIARIRRRSVVFCTGGGPSMVHVDDVVDGIRMVADSGRLGQRYILSGSDRSFREMTPREGRDVDHEPNRRDTVLHLFSPAPTPRT